MAPLLQPEKMAEPSASESSPETDRDFDPTAEMLVNHFDDERTLEEEEAMESGDDAQNELDDLQKEGDMPLEDLLAMYGYAEGDMNQADTTHSSSSDEILSNQDLTLDKEEIARDLLPHEDGEEVEEEKDTPAPSVHELLDTMDASVPTSRLLRSASVPHHQSESESESEDEDYVPDDDDDWKKVTIQVGSDYQAVIPEGLCKYDDAPAYENDDKLLWDPSRLQGNEVDEYLRRIHQPNCSTTTQGVNAVPTGSHVRDDEQALYLLLQCGHNIEEAHRRRRMQPVPPTDTMSLWSEEECRSFENGLRTYGKDFHLIQQNKVRTRSVGELVQFYYLWKKTERHDVFANKARLEKKKYTLHPGTTDYMDRFLDERENPTVHRDRSSSPNIHSLISGDHKRQHNRSLSVFGSGGSGCATTHSPTSSSTVNQHHHVAHHQQHSLHHPHHPHHINDIMSPATGGHFGVVGTASDLTGGHTNPDSFQLPLEFSSPAITLPSATSVTRINSVSHPVSLGESAHSSLHNSNNSNNSLVALDSLLALPTGSSLHVSPADNCLDTALDPKNGLPVSNLEDLAKNLTTHGIDRDSLESLASSLVTGASEFVGGLVGNSHFSLATTHHHLAPTLSSSSVATVTSGSSELNHEPLSSLKNIEMSIASVNSLGSSISAAPLVAPASEALLHSASANPR